MGRQAAAAAVRRRPPPAGGGGRRGSPGALPACPPACLVAVHAYIRMHTLRETTIDLPPLRTYCAAGVRAVGGGKGEQRRPHAGPRLHPLLRAHPHAPQGGAQPAAGQPGVRVQHRPRPGRAGGSGGRRVGNAGTNLQYREKCGCRLLQPPFSSPDPPRPGAAPNRLPSAFQPRQLLPIPPGLRCCRPRRRRGRGALAVQAGGERQPL